MSDVERRVRDAFRARARLVPDDLSPDGTDHAPGPDTNGTKPRLRPATVLPLLAAAAVIVAVAGGSVLLTGHQARPASPVTRPAPSGTGTATPALPSTPATSVAPPPPTPITTAVTTTSPPAPTTSTTSATTPPPPPSHFADLGVEVTLPPGWRAAPAPSGYQAGGRCFSPTGGGCSLFLSVGARGAAGGHVIDYPVVSSCGGTLTGYQQVRIDGQTAEYRRFGSGCGMGASEQWFVPTSPQVVFWHPLGADDASVHAAVTNALLPLPAGQVPTRDRVRILSLTQQPDGYHVSLQRLVGLASGDVPEPGGSYNVIIPIGPDPGGLPLTCADWKIPGYQPDQSCTLSVLAAQSAKGQHPADGSLPIDAVPMVLWSNGTNVTLFVTARSFPGGE